MTSNINGIHTSNADNHALVANEHKPSIRAGVEITQDQTRPGEPMDTAFLATEKRLVRKLDYTLMPIALILHLMSCMDRNNIAQARLISLEADLRLQGNEYGIAVSVLILGFVLMQLPNNMLLARVRPALCIPTCICLWAIVSCCTAAVQSFGALIAVRVSLSIAEAILFPGLWHLLSFWYTRKELAIRYANIYFSLLLASALSGLLTAGVSKGLNGTAGLAGWRWLFLIEGAISFLLGIIAFFFLPDFPSITTGSPRWLLTE